MKKTFRISFIIAALGFAAACKAPAPVVITKTVSAPGAATTSYAAPAPTAAAASSAPRRYAYPDVAGVWSGPGGTLTIERSNGGPFTVHLIQREGKMHTATATWGEPFHRHFKFARRSGRESTATLDSLTPTTITMTEENGRTHTWRRLSR